MIEGALSKYWQTLRRCVAHDDPMVESCNTIALVVASNQPFYPLYVYWIVSEQTWPTLFTFLSTPFFLAVPLLSKRMPRAGRALLPLTGIGNTILSAMVFGQDSGVEIFLIPCALIAATFFRPSDRWIGILLIAIALCAYIGLGSVYGPPVHLYSAAEYDDFVRLNATSAGTLSVFVGLIAAALIAQNDRS